MENVEVRNEMEEKLINLGSPEVDKIVSLDEETAKMPEGRKRSLNHVSMSCITQPLMKSLLQKVLIK